MVSCKGFLAFAFRSALGDKGDPSPRALAGCAVRNFCSHSVSLLFWGLFGVGSARLGDGANSVSMRDAAAQENEL